MKKSIYLKLQLKRAFKHYPSILLVTLIAVLGIGITVTTLFHINNNSTDKQKINIGIVGNLAESHVDVVVYALENIDAVIGSVNFVELSEDDAKDALEKNEIVGYIQIPDNYFEDIAYGDNAAARYVSDENAKDLVSVLTNEMALMLSEMVTETQKGIYSAVEIAEDKDVKKGLYTKIDELNFEYMGFVMNRHQTYDVEYLGIKDRLTYGGYYICGFLVFFLMIWGISCNKILLSKNIGLSRLLYTRGMKSYWQILCEYVGYFFITFITLLLIFVTFGFVLSFGDFGIRELAGADMLFCIGFVIKLIPVAVMFTAMHFMIYEIFSNIISSVLVQFIISVVLGYMSGCFYPNTFFPESVQKITSLLPSGAGFSYAGKMLTEEQLDGELCIILGYALLFILTAICVRNYKLREDGTR